MCGIAGAAGRLSDPGVVERQLRCLDHRGPDSWGLHKGAGCTIGQTRLAVIDVVTGDPPITNEDGTVGVSLNGEIYNYRELRRDLASAGHIFATTGDTEVLAHLAERAEPAQFASRLDGMFAFAVWDDRQQRLVLGRDRVGKKPLYYWTDGRDLVFGSEIKAVLAHPSVPRRLAPGAIAAFLGFGYVPTPQTFYEGIVSVPPGCVLVYEPGRPVRLLRYWEPPGGRADAADPLDIDFADAVTEVRGLLGRAVERRMVADVPLGAFLSGGVDSSAVVAFMACASSEPVKTFTIGFEDDAGFDEREYARTVARHLGTEHVDFVVRPDAVELIERLVWHHDQPFGDYSAIPTFILSELTRRHVTVALSGDGGDEMFAGYERFAAALALRRYARIPAPIRGMVRGGLSKLPGGALRGRVRSVQRFVEAVDLPVEHALRSWAAYVSDDWRETLIGPGVTAGAVVSYEEAWKLSAGAPLLSRMLDVNLRTYLLDDLLPKADRASMAHALEVRSPLLDTALMEFALRLPPHFHVRLFDRKRVLKAAVREMLPPGILRRRKRGFGVPLDRWFRTELRDYVAGHLLSPDARVHHHLRSDAVQSLVGAHVNGSASHGAALWALLTLELFLQREGW